MKKQILFTSIFIALLPSLSRGMDAFAPNSEFSYNFFDENNLPETTDLSTPQSPDFSPATTNTDLPPSITPSAQLSDDQIIAFFTNEANTTTQKKPTEKKRKNQPEETIEEKLSEEPHPIKKRAIKIVNKNTPTEWAWAKKNWHKASGITAKKNIITKLFNDNINQKAKLAAFEETVLAKESKISFFFPLFFDLTENDNPSLVQQLINANNVTLLKFVLKLFATKIKDLSTDPRRLNQSNFSKRLHNCSIVKESECTQLITGTLNILDHSFSKEASPLILTFLNNPSQMNCVLASPSSSKRSRFTSNTAKIEILNIIQQKNMYNLMTQEEIESFLLQPLTINGWKSLYSNENKQLVVAKLLNKGHNFSYFKQIIMSQSRTNALLAIFFRDRPDNQISFANLFIQNKDIISLAGLLDTIITAINSIQQAHAKITDYNHLRAELEKLTPGTSKEISNLLTSFKAVLDTPLTAGFSTHVKSIHTALSNLLNEAGLNKQTNLLNAPALTPSSSSTNLIQLQNPNTQKKTETQPVTQPVINNNITFYPYQPPTSSGDPVIKSKIPLSKHKI